MAVAPGQLHCRQCTKASRLHNTGAEEVDRLEMWDESSLQCKHAQLAASNYTCSSCYWQHHVQSQPRGNLLCRKKNMDFLKKIFELSVNTKGAQNPAFPKHSEVWTFRFMQESKYYYLFKSSHISLNFFSSSFSPSLVCWEDAICIHEYVSKVGGNGRMWNIRLVERVNRSREERGCRVGAR